VEGWWEGWKTFSQRRMNVEPEPCAQGKRDAILVASSKGGPQEDGDAGAAPFRLRADRG
jgi:hypothetical protein